MKDYFYVADFLQDSDDDDEAIMRCLNAARQVQKRTIIFNRKDYLISRSVLLPSDTTVIIDNCMIKQADETYDTVFRGDNLELAEAEPNGIPMLCKKLRNIRIIGRGTAVISGPDRNRRGYHSVLQEEQEMVGDFWGWRTFTVSLSNCDGFEIAGLTFVKSRCWTLSFDLCSNGHLHHLKLFTNVKNGDGIDLRSGCHHCIVEDISGTTSDDTIACTALFRTGKVYPDKNYLYSLEPSECVTDVDGRKDIHHISIRNVSSNGNCHGIICLAANECKVHDIQIENITELPYDAADKWREATVKIYTGYGSGYKKGDIRDVVVRNVRGEYAEHTVYSNADVEQVVLQGIQHNKGTEMKLDYPEGFTVWE